MKLRQLGFASLDTIVLLNVHLQCVHLFVLLLNTSIVNNIGSDILAGLIIFPVTFLFWGVGRGWGGGWGVFFDKVYCFTTNNNGFLLEPPPPPQEPITMNILLQCIKKIATYWCMRKGNRQLNTLGKESVSVHTLANDVIRLTFMLARATSSKRNIVPLYVIRYWRKTRRDTTQELSLSMVEEKIV